MAVTYTGLTIKFAGDTTKLSTALKNIQKETKATQSDLRAINQSLKFNPGNTDLLRQKQAALNAAYEQTKQKLDAYKQAMGTLEAKKERGEKLTDQEQRQYDQLQRSILTCENQLKSYEADLKRVNTEQEASSSKLYQLGQKFENVGNKLQATGDKMKSTGKTLSASVTAPVLGVGAAAMKVTADFDEQMSKVQAISGATGDDFTKLRDKARDMGAKTKFTATEAGEGLEYMAMAGWKTDQMLEGLPGILNLAAASGEELGTTSDIVTDALTAFGMKAEEAGHFADVLATASSNSNTNVSMLGESFKYVAPVAGSLKYSAEDTAVALGLMANSGIKASSAGTALRSVLTNMANPGKNAGAAMDKLGVSLDDGHGRMKSLREVMDDMRNGFKNLTFDNEALQAEIDSSNQLLKEGKITEKQYNDQLTAALQTVGKAEGAQWAQNAAMLAGKTGMSGLLSIVTASDKDYQSLTDSIDKSSQKFVRTTDGAIIPMTEALQQGKEWTEEFEGSAAAMSATMQDNLKGQITIIGSQLQELGIQIGDALMPILRAFADKLSGLVDWFSKLDGGTKTTIGVIVALAAAAGPLLVVFGTLIGSIGKIGTAFKAVSVAMTAFKNLQLASSIATKAAAAGQAIFNAVMNANPIMKVVTLLSALVAGLVFFFTQTEEGRKLWGQFTEALKETWDKVCKFFGDTIEKIKGFFGGLFDKVKEIGGNISKTFDNLKKNVGLATGIIGNVMSGNFKGAADKARQLFGGMQQNIVNHLMVAKRGAATIADGIGKALGFPNLGKTVAGVFDGLIAFVTNPLKTIQKFVKSVVDKIKNIFNFKWTVPKIKIPHFGVDPKGWQMGDLLKGTIPKLKIDWYAKGGSIEPNNPRLIGVGDSHEREWIQPESKLLGLIKSAVASVQGGGDVNVSVNVSATVNGNMNAYQLGQNIGNGINSVLKQRGQAAIA